jgi:hypothetical protein
MFRPEITCVNLVSLSNYEVSNKHLIGEEILVSS